MSTPDRRAGLDRAHPDLSIRRQCTLLSISRSGVYRCARPGNDDDDLGLMRRIDELFLAYPFLGSRRMAAMLSLIEPAIMIVMGAFVAFVLIALYLPIFSLADTIH